MPTSKTLQGGSKKSNGHKMDCKCPICKNMNKSKKGGGEMGEIKEDMTVDMPDNTVDEIDKDDEDEIDEDEIDEDEIMTSEGGKRKHKKGSKKSNGHKINCKCPICKNMRKGKKGGEIEEDMTVSTPDNTFNEDEIMISEGGKRRTKKNRKNRKSKKSRKTKKSRKSRKSRKYKKC